MSKKIRETLTLSADSMNKLADKRMKLTREGVKVMKQHSGELNFAGCASGYCQAWD